MPNSRIFLFGSLSLLTAEDLALEGGSPLVQSLCAYLALHQGQPLDRRRLAFLFWPRVQERAARRNLRQYLHRLRNFLAPIDPTGDLVVSHGSHVIFDPQRYLWVDAQVFRERARAAQTSSGQGRLVALQGAAELYRGHLLQDLYEDFFEEERRRYEQLYETVLQQLVQACDGAGQLVEAIYWTEQLVQAWPVNEAGYRLLMDLHFRAGDRAQALQAYERCCSALWQDLEVRPLQETEALRSRILSSNSAVPGASGGQLLVKPRSMPAPSSAVQPAPTARALGPLPLISPPLVGRDEDLRWLNGSTANGLQQGNLIFLDGEPGIGKTRLVEEWLSRLPGHIRVLAGEASEFEQLIPYHPLASALRESIDHVPWRDLSHRERWLPALVNLQPALTEVLPATPGPAAGAIGDHLHTLQGVEWFLRALLELGPLVIWLDEAHWADYLTWQALAYVGQRLSSHLPLWLIITYRSQDLNDASLQISRRVLRAHFSRSRELDRLSRAETDILGQAILGSAATPRLLERLYAETEGNPLFIIETARALLISPERWVFQPAGPDQGPPSLPDRVRRTVETRLDQLLPGHRIALQVAAVLGQFFSFSLLTRVAEDGERDLLAALEAWQQRGLVRETATGYQFTHGFYRRVAYDELSQAKRQWLHRQVGELLRHEGSANAVAIARHLASSDRPAGAIPYYVKAGQDALRVRSYHEARDCGLAALRLWRDHPREAATDQGARIDLNLQLARAYSLSHETDQALALLEETRRLAQGWGEPGRLAQVLMGLAHVFWQRSNPRAAMDHARAAQRWAQTADEWTIHAATLRMLGRTGIALSTFDDAIGVLTQHLQEVDGQDPRQVAVWSYLAVAWARVGDWRRAFEDAHHALQIAREQQSPSSLAAALMHQAFVQAESQRWELAASTAQQGLDLVDGLGFSPVQFMLKGIWNYAWGRLGGTPDSAANADARLRQLLATAEQEGYQLFIYLIHYFLAHLCYERGLYHQGLLDVRQALSLVQAAGDRWAKAVAQRLEADILMSLPDPDWPAVEQRLVGSVSTLRQIRARPDLARSYLSLRRLYDRAARMAWAVDCHYRALNIFEELGMTEELRAAQGQPSRRRQVDSRTIVAELTGPQWLES